MPKSENQKLKLLYILQILRDYTDEEHPIAMAELIERLAKASVSAERKSIYSDMEHLKSFGYDIEYLPSRTDGGYYLASREFELPELKVLVDAVCASRFVTASKSASLIKKLEQLTSKTQAVELQRQVYNGGRIKNENESIYYHVDEIHHAIHENRQISFEYLEWNLEKKLVKKREGARYVVSPWALLWNDENYYLVGYEASTGIMKHFRVDKIGKLDLLDLSREGKTLFEKCDLASYSTKTFGMYHGEEEIVTIELPNYLVGVVLDRFGKDVTIQKKGEQRFAVHVKVAVSGQFFGWLAGLGKEVVLSAPEGIRESYRQYLQEIVDTM